MEEAYSFLLNDIGLCCGNSVVVACSGGPDSMALLSLLIDVRKVIDINIIVAHVNHNVRAESADEMVFVRNYCFEHNLVFEYMKIDSYSSLNFESEARVKRYDFFDFLVNKYSACFLFTAHHGDDLMETILMRICRGSTMSGYGGFSRISKRGNYSIVRPFIHITKSDILDYNSSNGIKFVIDQTNFLDVHTRNRYRKYILPVLKKEDNNIHDKFYKFSCVMREYDEFIERQVDCVFDSICKKGIINVGNFKSLDKFIGMRVIYRFLSDFYKEDLSSVHDKHVFLIYDLIYSERSNMSINLPHSVIAVKEYDFVKLVKDINLVFDFDYVFDACVNLENGKCIEKVKNTSVNDNNVIRLCSGDLSLPLHVRNRRDGDRIYVLGMSGCKKVKDIFINSKVPIRERNSWPIVTDSNGEIVWIPGLKKSKYDRKNDKNCDIILKYY